MATQPEPLAPPDRSLDKHPGKCSGLVGFTVHRSMSPTGLFWVSVHRSRAKQAGIGGDEWVPGGACSRRRARSAAADLRSPRPATPRPCLAGEEKAWPAAEMVRSPFRVGRQPTSTATGERRLAPHESLRSLRSLEGFAGTPPDCLISVSTRRARSRSPSGAGRHGGASGTVGRVHVVARAAVGSIRAARTAGYRPAIEPISRVAAAAPPSAVAGIETSQSWLRA
jgi:hypothetical protein